MSEENMSGEAKREALMALRSQMQEMGGSSLIEALKGIKGKKDESESEEKEPEMDFDEMSKEDLIKLLKNK